MIALFFLLSGFAALLYQVVWQRTLFAIYGINVESVTMVVTAFMLGLGLGSLAGGRVSRDPTRSAVLWFAALEAGIGLFGLSSLRLIAEVGRLTLRWPPLAIGLTTFVLVLVPTVMMGATLPLLVAHFARLSGNVGRSLGLLYFINTLGSALASALAVLVLLRLFGQAGTVRMAAALNLTASVLVLLHHRFAQRPSRPGA